MIEWQLFAATNQKVYTMRTIKFLLIVIACVVIGLNCSGEITYTIEEVNGVSIVHNLKPKWDDEQKISLEFARQIGDFDAEDENFQFYKPYDIAIDKAGNMYILDAGNYRVQKLNSDGEFILSFLRQGEGPGELLSPGKIQIDNVGNIHVSSRNGIIQIFTSDGEPVNSYRPEVFLNFFELFDNGTILVASVIKTSEDFNSNTRPLIQINDQNGGIITKIGTIRKYEDFGMKQTGNTLKVDVDENGFIYFSLDYQNRIEKYAPDGEQIFSADRTLSYAESEKVEMIRVNIQGETVTKININKFSLGLQIDHKSRIWILSNTRQLTSEELRSPDTPPDLLNFEIYDSNGILLSRIPWEYGRTRTSYRIFEDRIYFLDWIKEMAVFEYKIIDK